MSKTPLALFGSLALLSATAFAAPSGYSEGRLTLTARVTSEGPEVTTPSGYRQNLVITRLGNRQILELLVQAEVIPTITGYSLVQRYFADGEAYRYVAVNATTQDTVNIPSDILEVIESNGVDATTTNTRNNQTTIRAKVHSTLSIDGGDVSLVEALTLQSATGTVGGNPISYLAVSSNGKFQGNLEGGEIIEGTIILARTKLVPVAPV
jgi:hypothetical protein